MPYFETSVRSAKSVSTVSRVICRGELSVSQVRAGFLYSLVHSCIGRAKVHPGPRHSLSSFLSCLQSCPCPTSRAQRGLWVFICGCRTTKPDSSSKYTPRNTAGHCCGCHGFLTGSSQSLWKNVLPCSFVRSVSYP